MRAAAPLAASAETTIQRRNDIDAMEVPLVALQVALATLPVPLTTAAQTVVHIDQLLAAYMKVSPSGNDLWSNGVRDAIHVIVPYRDALAAIDPRISRATDDNKTLGTVKGADVDTIETNLEPAVADRLIDVNTRVSVAYARWSAVRLQLHRWLPIQGIDMTFIAAQAPLVALDAASMVPRDPATRAASIAAITAFITSWGAVTGSLTPPDDFKVAGAPPIGINPDFKTDMETLLPGTVVAALLPIRPALPALDVTIDQLSTTPPDAAAELAITTAVDPIAGPILAATVAHTANQYDALRAQWAGMRILAGITADADVMRIDILVATAERELVALIANCKVAPQTAISEAASVTLAADLIIALGAVQVALGATTVATLAAATLAAAHAIPAIRPIVPMLRPPPPAAMVILALHLTAATAVVTLFGSYANVVNLWATTRAAVPAARDLTPNDLEFTAVRASVSATVDVFTAPGRTAAEADSVAGLKAAMDAALGTFRTNTGPLLPGPGPELAAFQAAIAAINTGPRLFVPAPLPPLGALAPLIISFNGTQVVHQEANVRAAVPVFVDAIRAAHTLYAGGMRRILGARTLLVAADRLYQQMLAAGQLRLLCYESRPTRTLHTEASKARADFDAAHTAFCATAYTARGLVVAPAFQHLGAAGQAIPPLMDVMLAANPSYALTESQRLIRTATTAVDVVQFGDTPGGNPQGPIVIEAASEQELDGKLAALGAHGGMLYALVHDAPGDQVALLKATAINLNANVPPALQKQQADGKRGATGWLYRLIPLANGSYLKEFRDYIRPSLYNV
jgi:hypothetical protein